MKGRSNRGYSTYLGSHMLDQLPRIPLATRRRLAAQVDEIVGVIVPHTHHILLGVV